MSTFVSDDRRYPKVEAEDDVLLIYFKLCKMGIARSITEASEFTARTVLQALSYESFCDDYERAYMELNSGKS